MTLDVVRSLTAGPPMTAQDRQASLEALQKIRQKRSEALARESDAYETAPLQPTLTLSNGETMPLLGLGTWKADEGQVYTAVKKALRCGYRHIDCAAYYNNEGEIGRALEEIFAEGWVRREEVFIVRCDTSMIPFKRLIIIFFFFNCSPTTHVLELSSHTHVHPSSPVCSLVHISSIHPYPCRHTYIPRSKLWNSDHGAARVRPALERSLRLLRLAYLDAFLIHWPVAGANRGPTVHPPLAETWRALEDCARAGLVRSLGVSNFGPRKLEALLRGAAIRPVICQVESHPYFRNDALIAFCRARGIAVTAYAPLGSPDSATLLNRKDDVDTAGVPRLLAHPTVTKIAADQNRTPAQVNPMKEL